MSVRYLLRNNVAVLALSNPPVNGLSQGLRRGIVEALDKAHGEAGVEACVLVGDGRTWPAGADIAEFASGLGGAAFASPTLNEVIGSLEQSSLPTIAAIHGTALGGGLETALGCHYRIATPKAKFGLPEVHLGILPGAGGTQRLPRLVGVEKGIDMMTSGRMMSSSEALETGVIEALLDARADGDADALVDGAVDYALGVLAADGVAVTPKALAARLVSNMPPPSGHAEDVFEVSRAALAKRAPALNAPQRIVDAVEACAAVGSTFEQGMAEEGRLFEGLFKSAQARALQHVFFAERGTTKVGVDAKPAPIRTAGVVGIGTMGGGIAMTMMNAGIPVTVVEPSADALEAGRARIRATYEKSSAFKKGKLTPEALDAKMALLSTSTEYAAFADVDVVVEAVFESLELKREIFGELAKATRPDALLCTNTSTLDVDAIAAAAHGREDRVVGMHFFSPANVMPLLENVRCSTSSADSIATVMALGKKLKKVPVLSGNCFGFIGNRMLEGYGREASFLVEEGAAPAVVDRVLKEFGMAMGYFQMSDLAGNDIGYLVRQELGADKLKGRYPELLDVLPRAGFNGQKTGAGWYKYQPENPRVGVAHPEADELIAKYRAEKGVVPREIEEEEIFERMMYALINEGTKVLEDGIALRPADIDIVWIMGYGYPRHRGGPMHYAEEVGLEKVLASLEALHERFPEQPHLAPSALLRECVESGMTLAEGMAARK